MANVNPPEDWTEYTGAEEGKTYNVAGRGVDMEFTTASTTPAETF